MNKKFPVILFVFLFTALLLECAGLSDSGRHGSSFEKSCGLLKKELIAVQDIDITIVPITDPLPIGSGDVGRRYKMDYSQRAAYVEANYSDLARAIKQFKSKKMEFETRFRDDVEIIDTLYYLSLSMPGSKAIPEFYIKAERMIGKGERLDLEVETVETFKEIKQFRLFFDPDMWVGPGERLMAELVREKDLDGILIHTLVGVSFMDNMNIDLANKWIHEYQNLLHEDHLRWLLEAVSKADDTAITKEN